MRSFYWRLLRQAPVLVWRAGDGTLKAFALAVALAGGLNHAWAAWIDSGWQGISPAWGFLPVGLLFVYGLLKANHEAFVALQVAAALPDPLDPAAFAQEFSSWLAAKRAAVPRSPDPTNVLIGAIGLDRSAQSRSRAHLANLKAEWQRDVDRVDALARSEFHERFRGRVVSLLGPDAAQVIEPKSLADLDGVAALLRACAEDDDGPS